MLAGSVVEALLLWAIQQQPTAAMGSAIAAARRAGRLTRAPDVSIERWDLAEYIEVATELDVIKAETTGQARLARGFRNLIHPGRATRLGQKCDRATALAAVAAVEFVVRDLTP